MSTTAEPRALGGEVGMGDEARGVALPQASLRRSSLERSYGRRLTTWRIIDATVGVGLLAGVVTAANLDDMPQGLGSFLQIRLSLKNILLLLSLGWFWPGVLAACGLYTVNRLRTGTGEWPRLFVAGAACVAFAMIFPLTSRSGLVTSMHVMVFGAVLVPTTGLARISARVARRRRLRARPRQVLLVGSGPLTTKLYRRLAADPFRSTSVVGFVDSSPHAAFKLMGLTHLGTVRDLEQILMHRVVDDVLIGLPVKSRYDEIREAIAACARVGVPASYSADLFGGGFIRSNPLDHVVPVVSVAVTPSPRRLAAKRAMDVMGALVLLVALSPLMLGVAIAVKLTSRGPVLFAQYRYGYMKRLFRMYKFRTMIADAERLQKSLEGRNEAAGPIFKIHDDPRITPVGRFLRKTSLDELPQIWHVLTGDMSLVGPRPMSTRDVGLFSEPWLMRRFSVRPGLTCLWQIGGRSALAFEQWIALDLQYIDTWSLGLDMKILLRTLPAILNGRGAM